MTASLEDYLKTASILSDKGYVRLTDIASRLGVAKPSAIIALGKLKTMGLIEHERYQTFILTEKGKCEAAKIRERYKIIAAFLQVIVGVSAKTAKKDACRIEHIISDEFFEKIKNNYTALTEL